MWGYPFDSRAKPAERYRDVAGSQSAGRPWNSRGRTGVIPNDSVTYTLRIKDREGFVHGTWTIDGDPDLPKDPWEVVVTGDHTAGTMITEFHDPLRGQCRLHGPVDSIAYRAEQRCEIPSWQVATSFTLNFVDEPVGPRTASVLGLVMVDNNPLSGARVSLSGMGEAADAVSDGNGYYVFTELRAGRYSVGVSGFDTTKFFFPVTDSTMTLTDGESRIVSFVGSQVDYAGVSGQVSVEGEGLNGVTVSLRGGPDGVDLTTTTNAAGQFAFANLRAGTYTVGISGWDDTDIEFDTVALSVEPGETGYLVFVGRPKTTSGLAGRISVDSVGLAGVPVTALRARATRRTNTDANGVYAFAALAARDYTVTVEIVCVDSSKDVTLELDKTSIVNFEGRSGATSPPRNLSVAAVDSSVVELKWDVPLYDGGSAIIGYQVFILEDGGGWSALVENTMSLETRYRHTGPTRHYRVAAINANGPGCSASTSGAPDPPTGLRAAAQGSAAIELRWNAPRYTGGAAVTGYRIEVSRNGGRTWTTLRSNTGTAATTFVHENLRPVTTRHYRVSANNLLGSSDWSDTASATTTEAGVPGVPPGLRAFALGTAQIDLFWRAPGYDGGAPVHGYRVEVSEDAGAIWQTLVADTRTTVTRYSHTGLAPASTRHYRIRAVNRIGAGEPSRVASATTDATAPDALTTLTAAASSAAEPSSRPTGR